MHQYAIFSRYGDNIGGNTYSHQIEQGFYFRKRKIVSGRECLNQFKSYSATRQFFIRIIGIGSFGIDNGHGTGKLIVGHMMIANDEIDAFLFGIRNLIDGFDAAVKRNNKFYTCAHSIIDSLKRYAVPFIVPIRNIIIDIICYSAQKLVNQRNGRCAIDIVISINQNSLLVPNSSFNASDCHFHVGQQKWIMQVV